MSTHVQNPGAPLQDLAKFLTVHNYHIEPTLDGKIHRFDRGGKVNNAWFVGRKWSLGDKDYIFAKAGDWSTGEVHQWKNDTHFTPEELKEAARLTEEASKKDEEEKQKIFEEVSLKAQKIFDRGITLGQTTYMVKKGINRLLGAKIDPDRTDNLVVPLRDTEGKIWNLQKILPEKLKPNNIDKIFLDGGKIKGLYCLLGEIYPKGRVLICEGFATGYSIHEATGHAVCCAFNAGNLLHVGKAIRAKYPEAQITICGDNDLWAKNAKGELWNVGREKATYTAAVINATKIFPKFKNLSTKPTDFNDLFLLEGASAVKDQIVNAPTVKDLEPVCEFTSNGAPKKPSESRIVRELISYYDGQLIQQNGELFRFVNTHWQHQEEEEIRQVKMQLQFLSGESLTSNQIESAFRHFVLKVPVSPVNLFQPNPFYANFLNGTLSISKMPGESTYSRSFREHSYADYITSVIPLNYEPSKCEVNLPFLNSVDRIFGSDPDKESKISALKQLFGACLTPAFPRIFLLVGPPASGKSTIAIIASKLVSSNNLSMVEPHEFRGFHMESMLGKLVNISTDIRTNEPIDDAMMKKIEDRVPVRIDRKFKTPVMAWLPAVHIFGCNKLPPNYEGDTGAFTRRATILEMTSFKASGNFNKNFAQEVFDSNPQGVLNFALEGLQMLLDAGGHFTNPVSGNERLKTWQMEYDPIGQFFSDLLEGQVDGQVKLEPGAEYTIERKKLWENFRQWHDESFNKLPHFSKHKFYNMVLERRFCTTVTIKGVRYFRGTKLREGASSNF